MKVGVILAEGPFLQNFLETRIEWTNSILPRKGEMLGLEVLKDRIDWDGITKKDITDRLKPEYKDWAILYDIVYALYPSDSEETAKTAHREAMRRMMDEYMGAMCYVENIVWRNSEEGCYPVVWLTNKPDSVRAKDMLDDYYAKAQKKDRKAFAEMIEEEERGYTFDWLAGGLSVATLAALWLIYKIVFDWCV